MTIKCTTRVTDVKHRRTIVVSDNKSEMRRNTERELNYYLYSASAALTYLVWNSVAPFTAYFSYFVKSAIWETTRD